MCFQNSCAIREREQPISERVFHYGLSTRWLCPLHSSAHALCQSMLYMFLPPDSRRIAGRNPACHKRKQITLFNTFNYSCWLLNFANSSVKRSAFLDSNKSRNSLPFMAPEGSIPRSQETPSWGTRHQTIFSHHTHSITVLILSSLVRLTLVSCRQFARINLRIHFVPVMRQVMKIYDDVEI